MRKARLTFASVLALALLWAGAGGAAAAPESAALHLSPAVAVTAGPDAASSGPGILKPHQRKARRKALKRCRKAKVRAKRKRCVKRVKAKYRRIARRQAAKPDKPKPPAAPSRVHYVFVTENTADPIQSSYFIPIPDDLIEASGEDLPAIRAALRNSYSVPATLTIRSGEAVRFLWDEGRDSAHQVTLWGGHHPDGVNPRDFEMSGSASTPGVTFQRTFRVPGVYELRCSLHRVTQILQLTVTR